MMENEALAKDLSQTFAQLKNKLNGFSQQTFNSKPDDGAWSAGEIASHLIKSYDVFAILDGATKNTSRNPNEKMEEVKKAFLNFDIKMNSPKEILPSAEPQDKANVQATITEIENRLQEIIATKNLSKTCTSFSFPGMGDFTRSEWLNFIIIHTQRHIHQLDNLKME